MAFYSSFFSKVSGLKIAEPQYTQVNSTDTGIVYTVSRFLDNASAISIIAASSNSNLSISGLNIVAASAIGVNSQVVVMRESFGFKAIEYPVTITGVSQSGSNPTPTPLQ